jgi:hypothetical protein
MVIYTPAGYSKEVKVPVFYLLHGAGDDETGWQKKGSADLILDNLHAAKKVVPMIVVMPNGFAQAPGTQGRNSGFEDDMGDFSGAGFCRGCFDVCFYADFPRHTGCSGRFGCERSATDNVQPETQ